MLEKASRSLPGVTAGVLVVAAGLLLGARAGDAQRFEETTLVTVVEVPVQVLVDGRPVRDLTADDFEIVDGRKRQEIIGFDAIDLAEVGGPEAEGALAPLPVAARRHFMILFDLSFAQPDSVLRAQEAARELVRSRLHPTDLVSVATYSASGGLRILLSFTPDREQVAYTLDTLGLVDPVERISDPIGLLVAELEAEVTSGSGGRFADIELENLRDLSVLTGRANRDQQQAQIFGLTESIKALGDMLSSVAGRVHVMLLSEGFDSSILLGNEGMTGEDRERMLEITDQAARGELWRVDQDERFGSGAAMSAVNDMAEQLRRSNAVIEAIDIGGLRAEADTTTTGRAAAAGARENSLFIMANETGGRLFRNTNDLEVAMGDLLDSTSVTYVLAFQPKDLRADGEFHRIKVGLKNGPRGAKLVHPSGYYAPRPLDEVNPMGRRLAMAGLIVGGREGGGLDTAALAVPVDTGAEASYVPVLIEIDGEDLVGSHGEDALPLELYAYAIERSGAIRDFFTRGITLDLAAQGPALRQRGLKFWGHLYLEPGDYVLRVVVRDGLTGEAGVTTVEVAVPQPGNAASYPPLVPEPIDTWVLLRDDLPEGKSPPFPFLTGEQPFVPAARPAVADGGRLDFCLFGADWREEGLEVSADLLAADGSVAGSAAVRVGAPNGPCVPASVELPLVDPGRYGLLARATTGAGREVRSQAIDVTVGG